MEDQLRYRDAMMAFMCINGLVPAYLCNMFIKHPNIRDRCTQNQNQLDIPGAVTLWNDLDLDLEDITSFTTFKQSLKTRVIDKRLAA